MVFPSRASTFALSTQLNAPDPSVDNICPDVPPVNITALLAPRFTLLPLRSRLPSALIAFPAIEMFAILLLPATSSVTVGVLLPMPTRLFTTSTKNVLVSTDRLAVLSRLSARAFPVTLAIAI